MPKSFAQQLLGTWVLEAFTLNSNAGSSVELMGPAPSGYLTYGADGWMSFQIAAQNRQPYDVPDLGGGTPEQTLAAARSFLAYAGPYTVDEAAACVVHHVQHCLIPNWVGDAHKRNVTLLAQGGLILTSDPFPIDHTLHTLVLCFGRPPQAGA